MKNMNEIKYPYLPEGRQIKYVDEHNKFIILAKETASRSKDQSTPTGSVSVVGIVEIAMASNKPPISNKNLVKLHKKYCIRRIFKIPSGQKYWMCPGCAGSENHAEYRVAQEMIQKGIRDFDLYLWGHWWCCKPCWDKMIEAGVKDVYLLENSEILFNPEKPGNIIGRQFK